MPATVDLLVGVLGRPRLAAPGERGLDALRGDRQAALLGLLVASRGRPIDKHAIEDELWAGGHVSPTAVRVNVARLRRRFVDGAGIDPIRSDAAGYELVLDDDEIDVGRFGAAVRSASEAWRRGDVTATTAAAALGESLWRGSAFQGVVDVPSVRPHQLRLDEERRDLRDLQAAGLLLAGDADAALEVLGSGRGANGYRESSAALRMAAWHARNRHRDALAVADGYADVLRAELTTAPSAELLELRALVADRSPVDTVIARALRIAVAPPRPAASNPTIGPSPGGVPTTGSDDDLVGRQAELAIADALVAAADPRVWVVEGAAGSGKTRLGRAVAARARRAGLAVAWASCPRGTVGELRSLHDLLADLLPHVDADLVADRSVGAVLRSAFPDLAPLVTGAPDDVALPAVEVELAQVRLYSALERLVAAAPPALVVIDDVQWIDDRLGDVIGHLIRRGGDTRWLLLVRAGTTAPAAIGLTGDVARGGARIDALRPLGPVPGLALARATAPWLAGDVLHDVVERAHGNPFTLIEMARHAGAGGDLATVPATIEAVVAAELARLDDATRGLAEIVAVAGRPHPLGVVLDAAAVPRGQEAAAVAALTAIGIIETDDRMARVWPGHDLVREAITGRMLDPQVREAHRRLADGLAADPGHDRVLRLEHLLEAGDTADDEAEAAAAAAILDSRLDSAPGDVAALGRSLIARTGAAGRTREQIATRLRISAAGFAIGNVAAATALLDAQREALDALGDPALDALALLARADVSLHSDRADARWQEAEAVLDRLGPDEPVLAARLATWAGHAATRADRFDPARALADRAAALYGDRALPEQRLEVTLLRTAISMGHGAPPAELDQHLAEVEAIAAATNEPGMHVTWAIARLDQAARTATLDDLESAVDRAQALATPVQRVEVRWWVLAARAGLDLMRGDLAAGSTSYLDAMQFGAGRSVALAVPTALLHRFEFDRGRGRLGDFHALLPPPSIDQGAPLLAAQVQMRLAAGDLDGARLGADLLAFEGCVADQGPGRWPIAAAVSALTAFDLGHARLGEIVADELDGRPDTGLTCLGLTYQGSLSHARGLAVAAAGRVDEALELLHAAVERETWFGSPPWIARAARATATVHERRARAGDGREAARLRRRADTAEALMTAAPAD